MSKLSEPTRQGSTRRAQQKEDTLRAIKAAALARFREHGYEATTTKQIADDAGVAHGTVFLVAPTKEGLLVVVLEEKLREVALGRLSTLPRRSIATQVLHVVEALFDFFAADRPLSRALLKGMMFFSDPVAKARRDEHVGAFLALLVSLLEKAQTRGEIESRVDTRKCATNVFAVYLDVLRGFLDAETPDRKALGESFASRLALLLRGSLVRRKPAPSASPLGRRG